MQDILKYTKGSNWRGMRGGGGGGGGGGWYPPGWKNDK